MTEFKYFKESKADDALKYWGDFIIKSKKVQYVAVVKKNGLHFCLEIGKDEEEDFNINDYIILKINNLTNEEIENLYKTAPFNIQRLIQRVRNYKSRKHLLESNKRQYLIDAITTINLSINSRNVSKFIMDDDEIDPHVNEYNPNNDFDYLSGGNPVSYKQSRFGTLGGIFKLRKFKNEYFGISNWHVIGLNEDLGKQLYIKATKGTETNLYEYGNLSWSCLDDEREVGFIHFKNLSLEKIKKQNICSYSHSGYLNSPKIHQKVKKCGQRTKCNCDDSKCLRGIIHSVNATIKVNSNSRNSEIPFKNQILIKNKNINTERPFSKSGDSGSIIVNEANDVLGLLFGRTESEISFSVANNINNIFNKTFDKPQSIMVNGRKETLYSFDLEEFV